MKIADCLGRLVIHGLTVLIFLYENCCSVTKNVSTRSVYLNLVNKKKLFADILILIWHGQTKMIIH